MASARKSSKSATPWNAESVQPLSLARFLFVNEADGALVSGPGEGVQAFTLLVRSYQGGTPKLAILGGYIAQKDGRQTEGQDTRKYVAASADGRLVLTHPSPGHFVVGSTVDAAWTLPVAATILREASAYLASAQPLAQAA